MTLLSEYTQQAEVTNWPARILLVLAFIAITVWALWAMRRGWRNRQKRQDWIPAPIAEPADPDAFSAPIEGLYLGSATAGDWMDRIAVHDLGVRSRASVSWAAEGVWIDRVGARSVLMPASSIVGMRLDRGIAGTVKAKDSVIIWTWRLGDAVIETGFRADETAGHRTVLDGLASTLGLHIVGNDIAGNDIASKENGESRHV